MDFILSATDLFLVLGIFTVVVVTIFLFEFRRVRNSLLQHEQEMSRRMYQLSILRELGERIGYSLKIEHIVDVIIGSLRRLLEYSTVSYMLLTTTPEGKTRIAFSLNIEKPVNPKFIDSVKQSMLASINTLMGRSFTLDEVEETISGTITDPTASETVGSFFNVPIVIDGVPVGLMNIADTKIGRYQHKETEILYTIMAQASDAVAKLERVLKIEKGKLNSMVESMADGVLMIDRSKQLTVINPAANRMLGLTSAHPTIFEVLDALANQFDLRTRLEESMEHDKLIVAPAITINGHFLQILVSPVKDESKSFLGAVVLFHDITKEKELEKMREDFTSMMVHELRSPLTGIRGIADLLTSDKVKSDAAKYNQFVGLISTNSQDMLALVNDLLDVAKLESGKFQLLKKVADIAAIIDTRVNSFKSLAEQASLKLTAKIDPSVPKALEFDEHKVTQVLNNLLSNAIKFTRTGGSITVSAFLLPEGRDLAQRVVEQSLTWPGIKRGVKVKTDSIVVAVTDSGLGIPAASIPQLFNKFVQLENSARSEKKGTGLGLVISKGIIEAHQGTIGLFSEEGEGSTFYITLPTAPQPAPVASAT